MTKERVAMDMGSTERGMDAAQRQALVGVSQELTVAALRLFDPAQSVDDFLHTIAARLGCRVALCLEETGDGLWLRGAAGLARASRSLPLPATFPPGSSELALPYVEVASAQLTPLFVRSKSEAADARKQQLWLALYFQRAPRLPRQYQAMLDRVALHLGVALGHRRLYERLQQRERTLRVASSKLHALIDHMPTGILAEDEHGNITHVNRAFCELLGGTPDPDDLIGTASPSADAPGQPFFGVGERFGVRIEELRSNGDVVLGEVLRLADGRVLERDHIPIQADEAECGALWNYRDVTHAHRAAEEIRQLNEDLERRVAERTAELATANKDLTESLAALRHAQDQVVQAGKMAAVGQLAAGFAHEINNPLGVILGFAQGLDARVAADSPLRMPVASIVREAVRCKELVQSLLTFSRTEGSQTRVDVSEMARTAALLLTSRAKMQHVELGENHAASLPLVRVNKTRIEQVIVTLGNNALDAMPNGGTLSIRTAAVDGDVLLAISDSGCGIPEEVLPRIFEPFFTTKEVGKGTGLGLSLAYEIVHQHGGAIDVTSRLGEGTRVVVRLPSLAGEGRGAPSP